ncbi:transglycosylase SLT domain-containing protein [Caldimonas tepidiphila]|uniref:transglycosylase SLT domain-containing protein n=1 Tax=Caldimonas tepidiphila TaxID=2315841 RepID=UPI000E5AA9B7|nr:transglycosylase SLT domain-containing protein [Caldimonas tepidiphila]
MIDRLHRAGLALGLGGSLLFAGCASVPSPAPGDGALAGVPTSDQAQAPAAPRPLRPGEAALKALEGAPALPSAASTASGDAAEAAVAPEELLKSRDLWTRIRNGFAMPNLENDLVRDREQWYSNRPDAMKRMTERSSRYLFHIVEEIEWRGMPTELALLPFVESAFNPQALSVAQASGMWQFIPSTGKYFDLKQNLFRDDRRDVLASTRAALDYLSKLYGMFGDWHLALAAYNWGEGSVQRAIERNRKAGLPTDYESLRMPAETRHYVPKLQAIKNLLADPQKFGLSLPTVENHPYFLSVPIERDLDVALAAKLAGLTLDEFKALNPSLNKPVILAAGTPQVLLPYQNANRFITGLARHTGPTASWTAWVVPKTMRPEDAARQLGTELATLREVNKIPPRMLVKAGSTLLVPRTQQRADDVDEHIAQNAMMQFAPDVPEKRRVVLRAGKGETVATLARRYKLPADDVAEWNRLGAAARFKPGQQVVVYLPNRVAAAAPKSSARQQARSKPAATTAVAKARKAAPAARTAKARQAPGRPQGKVQVAKN